MQGKVMKPTSACSLIAALLVLAAGGGSGSGQDSRVDNLPSEGGLVSDCSTCHNSANSPALDPLTTNGSGSSGKHIKHVQERAIACERCHKGYLSAPTHMNGTRDTGDPVANLTQFNIVGATGAWTGDTGAMTGSCADISCHGGEILAWYGNSTWTLPASCASCHVSSYAAALDPLVTNASGSAGKHEKHVADYAVACTSCHLDYPSRISHANGAMEAQDPSVPAVWFDSINSSGTWTNDTGPGTGACSSLYCHGAYSGEFTYFFYDEYITVSYAGNGGTAPDWYSATGLGCDSCHGNPPTRPNSTLKYGWHNGMHANAFVSGGNECQFCHPHVSGSNGVGMAVIDSTLHANGTIDVQPTWTSKCFYCH